MTARDTYTNGHAHLSGAVAALQTIVANVPAELRSGERFVVWRMVERDGRPTKPPYDPRTGTLASSTDSSTWAPLPVAARLFLSGGWDGLGRAFAPEDGVVGIDLDHCRDAQTGEIAEWAQAIIRRLASYSEVSPSGEGVHIFVRGGLPGARRKTAYQSGAVEMYDRGRYFTITGQHLDGTPLENADRQDELAALYSEIFGPEPPPVDAAPAATAPLEIEDAQLLEIMFSADNGADILALWNGDTSAYGGDDSAADLALCNHLAFYTRCDRQRMDRLFRKFGLMRPKWDKRHGATTYGQRTIEKAIQGTTRVFGDNGDVDAESVIELPPPDGLVDADRVSTPVRPALPFRPIDDLFRTAPEKPPWVWDDYLALGGVTLLAATAKTGKTTFEFALLAAIGKGEAFLGRPTRAVRAVVLSEERETTLRDKLNWWGSLPHVTLLMRHQAWGVKWPEIIRQAVECCRQQHAELLVIDTFTAWAGLEGDRENDAGAVQEAFRPLLEAASTGVAVLLVHHQRKASGEHGARIRGSGAMHANVDISIELERAQDAAGSKRVLKAVGRFSTTPEQLWVALTDNGYEVCEQPEDADADEDLGSVRAWLREQDGPRSTKDLEEALDLKPVTANRHLNALLKRNMVSRQGDGKRGSPFLWAFAEPPVELPTPEPTDSADEGSTQKPFASLDHSLTNFGTRKKRGGRR